MPPLKQPSVQKFESRYLLIFNQDSKDIKKCNLLVVFDVIVSVDVSVNLDVIVSVDVSVDLDVIVSVDNSVDLDVIVSVDDSVVFDKVDVCVKVLCVGIVIVSDVVVGVPVIQF